MTERHDGGGRRLPRAARWLGTLIARFYLRRPEQADVIAMRYRTPRALLAGLANEMAYRLGWARAPALLFANFELTNRCNLRCTFCPTGNRRMTRPRGFMSPRLFGRVLRGARPLEFALLFQWGESLLHPHFEAMATRARRAGLRTLITTNGTLLDDERVAALLRVGLERVTVSVDGDERSHEAVRGVPLSRVTAGIERLVAARDAADAPMAVDVSMVVSPETERAARSFAARFADRVDRVQLIPLLTEGRRRTRCREPWRGGLVVLQDGRVTACCVDHDGALAVGDAREDDLRTIFNGPAMRALRRAHVEGPLPDICARCVEYPSDAAAPRFSSPEETSDVVPTATREREPAERTEP